MRLLENMLALSTHKIAMLSQKSFLKLLSEKSSWRARSLTYHSTNSMKEGHWLIGSLSPLTSWLMQSGSTSLILPASITCNHARHLQGVIHKIDEKRRAEEGLRKWHLDWEREDIAPQLIHVESDSEFDASDASGFDKVITTYDTATKNNGHFLDK